MTKPTLPDLSQIQTAEQRIRPKLGETPLLTVPDLNAAIGQPLGLKCESLQRTGSFKARGALNWLLTASADELRAGLVTVSAGNHAIALAWAAAMQDVPLTVVMPEGSSPLKIRRTQALGAVSHWWRRFDFGAGAGYQGAKAGRGNHWCGTGRRGHHVQCLAHPGARPDWKPREMI